MKKLFLVLAAAFAMVACQTDINEVGVVADGVATVEFEVGTPQMRAYSDGSKATQLQYAVYDANGNILPELTVTNATINGSTIVRLELAKNKNYSVIFWAAAEGAPYEVTFARALADAAVTVDYTNATCNDENRDAFYAYKEFEVQGAATLSVELRRPFAQVNIGASDVAEAAKSNFVPSTSTLVVKNVFSTLNLVNGTASDNVEKVTFTAADVPTGETFPVTGYDYMAMSYVLVGKDKASYDVEYTIKAVDGTEINNTIGAVPMQANYRTNIYGKLLTSITDINVEIKPGYSDNNKYEIIDGKVNITVDNTTELVGAFDDPNVDVIILGEDINLNDLISRAENNKTFTIAADKELTIKLNGNTLTANYTPVEAGTFLFEVLGTLNVENGTIIMTREDAAFNPSYCTNVFHTSFNGTVNLNGVTAINNGGAGMAYVCDMSNATNATYNVENSTLKSSYIAVRVFNNNKNGVHNVIIKNSTLEGKYCVWTQYYLADGYTQEELDRQLNLDIFNNENTFTPAEGKLPILFGYNSYVSANGNGITKVVSEDGTVVTLGSLVENGVIWKRGFAGAEENTTVKKVIVGEGIATLYDRTFRRFYALEEVVLPSTLTTIGAAGTGVFQSCTNLKNVVIPESVTTLGVGTFAECTSLTSINIPAGVTRIEKDVFRNTGLTSIEFHAGVTYFGNYAFRDCEELTEITINAPSFTVESDTFLNAAGPFPAYVIKVANDEMKAYLESRLSAHQKTFITVVGPTKVSNIEELNAAIESGKTVILNANIENATIKLPANLSNFTLRAAAGVVLKNTTISAADGNAYHYENLTFDGLTFENGRILLTGWRNGEEVIKNLTITNCVFQNLDDTTNTAPVHINKDAAEAVENFTFTNNVINGAVGGSKSGVYAQVTGNVVFENNVINNVSFRPYVIQVTTDDGIADSFSVKGNTFSGSSVGRAQGLGNNDAGTDAVQLVVSGNIFKDITGSQQICYWNFNAATTTADLSKNYYSIDIEANPSGIYYNAAATSVEDLKAMGVYPFYTELNADGTINLNSLKQAE